MKKFIFALVVGCVSALAIPTAIYAQYTDKVIAFEQAKSVSLMDYNLASEKDNTVGADAYSIRAQKNFSKSYKEANNVKWAKVADGFIAGFTADGVRNTIYYDKKGKWEGSIKGYAEDKFSRDVRNIVKRTYYDYAITYVEEIETAETEGTPTYLVHVEDANTLKLVRVGNGEMDVYKEYTKGIN